MNNLYKKVEVFNSKGENITPIITHLNNLINARHHARAYNFLNRPEIQEKIEERYGHFKSILESKISERRRD